jgi:predicted TIM-barrel fold metal-dependent hydrolase
MSDAAMQTKPKTIHGTWNDAPDAVTLIDAHHHLWEVAQNKHPGLRGDRHDFFMGDNSAIRRDYLPGDYRRDAVGHNVLTTVHCEAEWERDDQLGETRWISSLAERHGLPGAIVAHAWFDRPNSAEIIAAQAAFPLVRGIRSKPVTAATPDKMTPGAPGTMQDDRWLRGFALLEKYGLSWDLRVPFWHLEEAAAVARAFPGTPVGSQRGGARRMAARHGDAGVRTQCLGQGVRIRDERPRLGLRGEPARRARRDFDFRHRAFGVCDQLPGRQSQDRL